MVVDAHQHVNWHGYDAGRLLSYMDQNGISQAWLLTWEERDGGLTRWYEYLDPRSVEEGKKIRPRDGLRALWVILRDWIRND